MTNDEAVAMMVKRQMDEGVDEMRRILAKSMYDSAVVAGWSQVAPRPRWRRVIERVQQYFATLWQALRGDDPYDREDLD